MKQQALKIRKLTNEPPVLPYRLSIELKETHMHNLKIVKRNPSGLLTVNEIAQKLGVAPRTIRKWQHEGKLPFVKLFGAVRFDEADIDQLILNSKTQKGLL